MKNHKKEGYVYGVPSVGEIGDLKGDKYEDYGIVQEKI